jgi:hypothetical protein
MLRRIRIRQYRFSTVERWRTSFSENRYPPRIKSGAGGRPYIIDLQAEKVDPDAIERLVADFSEGACSLSARLESDVACTVREEQRAKRAARDAAGYAPVVAG